MSKLTTKGDRRRDAKIQVMTANKRTVGATNYTPSAKGMKGKPKVDKSETVPARNFGKKGATKGKVAPPGKGKGKDKGKPAFLQNAKKKGKK